MISQINNDSRIMYIVTAISLFLPLYIRVQLTIKFLKDYPDLPFSIFLEWPLAIIILSMIMLLISSITYRKNPILSTKIALFASIIGISYYIYTSCPFLLGMALFLALSPINIILFFVPCIFLGNVLYNSISIFKINS